MTTTRQFVACKYRIADTRTFTFHNDGEPVADGDVVRVPNRGGDGWKKVYVADAAAEKPADFETKAILGLHVEEEPTPLEAAASQHEAAPGDPFGLPSLD